MRHSVRWAKMTRFVLSVVRDVAVKGAERASYKGTFEADVPKDLQKVICERLDQEVKKGNRGAKKT